MIAPASSAQLRTLLLSPSVRPLRFAGTGLIAAALQLSFLTLFTGRGVNALAANLVAFLIAAQLNFVLSATFTWRERLGKGPLARRWLTFHGSIAAMAVLNLITFSAARLSLPVTPAAALGIGVAALGNYVAGDRLVFR